MTQQLQTLRQHIFAFYEKHDPEKLSAGVDIDGMANWALKMGQDSLNDLLSLQYGSTIDFSQAPLLEQQQQQQQQMEEVFAPPEFNSSSQSSNEIDTDNEDRRVDRETMKRQSLRQKLIGFYREKDNAEVEEGVIEELVEVGVLHGEQRLNEDLAKKYGHGFLSTDEGDDDKNDKEKEYDELKVRAELRHFYSKHDPAYLETPDHMDQVMTLMSQVGKEAVYDKLFTFYGVRVDNVDDDDIGDDHGDHDNANDNENNNADEIKDVDKLRAQLKQYYERYDKEEVENIDDVIELGMDIGMSQLNQNMQSLYGASLSSFLEELQKNNANGNKKVSKLRQMHIIKSKKIQREASKKKVNPYNANPSSAKMKPMPIPRTVPVPMPKVEKSRKIERAVSEVPIPPQSRKISREHPMSMPIPIPIAVPPKVPDRRNVTETERSKRMEREQKEDAITNDEVSEEELRNFYGKHDEEKLGHMPKILRVAKKIGRRNLNKKLMGFYGADLQTYANEEEDDQEEEEEDGEEEEEEEEVDYEDLDQLREDLKTFYEEVDANKVNDLDQIVQLGKRLGRRVLVKKLFKIYNKSVDALSGRQPPTNENENEDIDSKPKPVSQRLASSNKHEDEHEKEHEAPPPAFEEQDHSGSEEGPEEHEEEEENTPPKVPPRSPQRNLPPSPSRRVVPNIASSKKIAKEKEPQLIRTAKMQRPASMEQDEEEEKQSKHKVRTKYRAPDLPQHMNMPPSAKMKSNVQIKALKQKGIPVIPIMGINLAEMALKKTGRNVNRTLRKVKSKKKQEVHSLYQLPKRQRNYTAASMKLLSVNLRASSNQDNDGKGNGNARKQLRSERPRLKPKVELSSLIVEVKQPNLADGPCPKYTLDMSNKGPFGVCKCGFTKGQHSKKVQKMSF